MQSLSGDSVTPACVYSGLPGDPPRLCPTLTVTRRPGQDCTPDSDHAYRPARARPVTPAPAPGCPRCPLSHRQGHGARSPGPRLRSVRGSCKSAPSPGRAPGPRPIARIVEADGRAGPDPGHGSDKGRGPRGPGGGPGSGQPAPAGPSGPAPGAVRGGPECLESLPMLLSGRVRVHTGWDEELRARTAGVLVQYHYRGRGTAIV